MMQVTTLARTLATVPYFKRSSCLQHASSKTLLKQNPPIVTKISS